jgi:hypothetical protein
VGWREVLLVVAATLLRRVVWCCGGWRETNGAGVERGCCILRSNAGKRKRDWQHVEQTREVRSAVEARQWCGMVADQFFRGWRRRLPVKAVLVDGGAYGRRALVEGIDGATFFYLLGIL